LSGPGASWVREKLGPKIYNVDCDPGWKPVKAIDAVPPRELL
jgi:hypothetical protein